MVHQCDKPCGNKTASGYCATTVCINPKYSNIGTVQYGQGVQKRIITNADRIRSMTDEELAQFIWDAMDMICPNNCYEDPERLCVVCILDYLKQEATDA